MAGLTSTFTQFKKARVAEYAAPSAAPAGEAVEKSVEQKLGPMPGKAITLNEIQRDKITRIAEANWSVTKGNKSKPVFSAELVDEIYRKELTLTTGSKTVPLQRVMVLEISQYLENYLWPNFDPATATFEHVMSIILMVNEKFRENVPAWRCFHDREDVFPAFSQRVFTLKDEKEHVWNIREKINYLLYMIHCFQSLEDEMVRGPVLKLAHLKLWHALSPGRLQLEFFSHPQEVLEPWKKLLKKEAKLAKKAGPGAHDPKQDLEVRFLPSLIQEFLEILESTVSSSSMEVTGSNDNRESDVDEASVLYCERFTEFLIDLLSQLPTRRYLLALVEDAAVVIKCRMSPLYTHQRGRLFGQLVDLLRFYEGFEIDEQTGAQLTDDDVLLAHCSRLQAFQRLVFKAVPKLHELALTNIGAIEKRDALIEKLSVLNAEEMKHLVCEQLKLISPNDPWANRGEFLIEVVVAAFEKRLSQRQSINALPLYPNEEVMWDESLVPSINYTGEGCLALPKLNLQFLTLHDYLLRNFNLFRLESTYEIREDIHDVLKRMGAYINSEGDTKFSGWARMAVPIQEFKIVEVKQPNIGELKPAAVNAEVTFSIGIFRGEKRSEWDELKEHDVLFLLSITPPPKVLDKEEAAKLSVPERFGLVYVRGCEIIEMRDEGNQLMNDFTGRIKREDWKPPQGEMRTALISLDSAQYQIDVNAMAQSGADDVYGTFNLLMRRKPKENNFKAILESIRDLMNEDCFVPEWLHDIFLGYGDPAAAQWHNMPQQLDVVDFKDTFIDANHLVESFPSSEVQFLTPDGEEDKDPRPPFRVTLMKASKPAGAKAKAGGRKRNGAEGENVSKVPESISEKPKILVETYVPPDPGPYPQDQPKKNSVRFTPVQVGAIISGVQPGLTMVVGPPGTGKTDTAVQILNVLYHNCPSQRTLLITHSNQALNDLFEKIMQRDVPARYLLRLGQGEQELETELDFSRQGRVNAMLSRRLELLAEVERLARTLNIPEDAAYTCETAAHFWLLHVLSRWEEFVAICEGNQGRSDIVKEKFPFKEYFKDSPQQIFGGASYARDMRAATGCFRHLKTMFQELEECRAFELLKSTADRANYLMAKQAKIVAMTCTHAALKRRDFLQLGFKYDNLLMEESAQILEIETFIPMLLQRQEDGRARLKRCILIGDHHQLPPVVKNMAFQKYSHMDQSLFTRFVRLGVPYVELNAQGRARPSMAKLYNWRYRELGDLKYVREGKIFHMANAGFAHEYQLIDVPDFEGKGETEPNPWFYQNLGEAEYVVSVFQYMRLLGYPANKITILSTYNGQKHLIRDVIERRCAHHPLFGRPSKITTVDRFQGQQNDFILLSLVRTRMVGHLRDVRRLVVAMSRARLGLYVFCRRSLFEQCYELQPTFQLLLQRPDRLAIVPDENCQPSQRLVNDIGRAHLVSGLQEMAMIVGEKFNYQANFARHQALIQAHGYAPDAYGSDYMDHTTAPPIAGFVSGGQLAGDSGVGGDSIVADGVASETPTEEVEKHATTEVVAMDTDLEAAVDMGSAGVTESLSENVVEAEPTETEVLTDAAAHISSQMESAVEPVPGEVITTTLIQTVVATTIKTQEVKDNQLIETVSVDRHTETTVQVEHSVSAEADLGVDSDQAAAPAGDSTDNQ
ncbi:intron-binding protein aquarius [Marchantia polymorpha subsp. ruderalis]|uniref:Intron-binding protein aquarius n=2 Tax=Marchantia polymorpha TaxID=3197 RepID=A0AAF6BSR7_MARPO|nr:hypothetical protein MARPO_0170s0020 [Marchantia polymorpha]BBN15051.1 hypothetical protein Mp_6g16570 [Marchantia polymorpha subsp. ruderalis]|eukprot:PTQ28216.1 hypothetical protein MARPO_0170s0020 [Marchantia polymorpha]